MPPEPRAAQPAVALPATEGYLLSSRPHRCPIPHMQELAPMAKTILLGSIISSLYCESPRYRFYFPQI